MIANSVADTSHHNGRVNFPRSVASGLIGVIQKATQGEAYVDQTFKSNRKAALDAGLLFGAPFVTHIHEELNRWPGFYSGHTIKRVLGSTVDPVLRNCWFWLATARPRSSRISGRVGRCGNIPTAASVRIRTTSRASAIATETSSTAMKRR